MNLWWDPVLFQVPVWPAGLKIAAKLKEKILLHMIHTAFCILLHFLNAGVALFKLASYPLCQDPQCEKHCSICFKSFPSHLSCINMAFPGAVPSIWKSKYSTPVWPTSDSMEVRKRKVSFCLQGGIQRWERWADVKQRELPDRNHVTARCGETDTHSLLLTQGPLGGSKYYCPPSYREMTQIKNNKLKYNYGLFINTKTAKEFAHELISNMLCVT